MKDKISITVPETHFVLKSDSMYQIQPKLDASAPDGFKERGTTKLITPDIGNTTHAPFNEDMKVWDTGFYKSSPVLRGMKEEEKEKFLKDVEEFIVKPVQELKGEDFLSHQESNRNLDDFGIEIRAYRVFNTADPLQRLALYFAVLNKDLAPKEHSSNPIYKKAQYTVVNREEAVNVRQERELLKTEAIGIFYMLEQTDRPKLLDTLEYLNIANSATTDKATLTSLFTRWLDDYQNSKIFVKTYNDFKTESGAEELYIYKKLKELDEKELIKTVRGEVILDSKPIGSNFKLAANYLMNSKEDKQKFAKLVEQLD